MNIAFLSENPPKSMAGFSGIPYFMAQSLRSVAGNLTYLHTPPFDLEVMFAAPEAGRKQLKEIGEAATQALRNVKADVVVFQGSSMIPYIETDRTTVLWHDSTWQSLLQIAFDEFSYCHPLLYEWDQRVIDKCDFIVYAADWVRTETLRHFDVDAGKLAVIPFGANVPAGHDAERQLSIEERLSRPCELTFIGVDWIRKGLPVAHSLVNQLNLSGFPTVLNVIGCSLDGLSSATARFMDESGAQPFDSGEMMRLRLRHDRNIRAKGFLSKERAASYHEFSETLARTSFLVHPASFECFGVALADANAFGVPVLAIDAFGPKTIIKPGVNGHLFHPQDFIRRAAAVIQTRIGDYQTYVTEASGALAEYRRRLNWATSCNGLLDLVSGIGSGRHV